ncbi:MAG: DUF2029 domain-containing protein [Chlorobiaceae bacterium]|nr:DUF2029 domain-containing protein [Chlorobiaceae bacterium]
MAEPLSRLNAFLTTAVCGAVLFCARRDPASPVIGLSAIKPHPALLFPVALIATGAWRTLITAAVTERSLLRSLVRHPWRPQ